MTQVFSQYLCPYAENKGESDKDLCINPENAAWTYQVLYEVPLKFLWITVKALLVGFFFGMITCLATKYLRFLTRNPIQETFFMMLMALLAYYVGEILYASGVSALILCAVL